MIKLRPGLPSDAEALNRLCRRSGLTDLKWLGPVFVGRRWWRAALESSAAETTLCLGDGGIAGLCVLVIDEEVWRSEHKARQGTALGRAAAAVLSPRFLLALSRKKGIAFLSMTAGAIVDVSMPRERTWLELIVVAPGSQRQGLGRRLLEHCDRRTQKLGRRHICLRVDVNNGSARQIYERAGYVKKAQSRWQCTYAKELPEHSRGTGTSGHA